ncbi:MAG: hypothetical protein HZB53_09380 [Chloroflexi bacterium]|nr:hypothetical protein [Chloroflexota bacterium]
METAVQLLVRLLAFCAGAFVIGATLRSMIATFILPRSVTDPITRFVFRWWRSVFDRRASRALTYEVRDRAMAFFAPVTLLALLASWIVLIWVAFALAYWALGADDIGAALALSGSSLFTLGFVQPPNAASLLVVFGEAAIGLMLVAVLISYLPTMYSAFARREAAVTMLEVRAGSPPSAPEMISRYNRIHGLGALNSVWASWEAWFADIEESHTSLAALAFFRSPQPDHSWVTAAGAVLDAAALVNAVVAMPHDPQADLCIRAGYLALRRIADVFLPPHHASPEVDDPISISRQEFDAAWAEMAAAGVPLVDDSEAAWRSFRGWRVNYDSVLLQLAAITMAPYAPWSSDRSLRVMRRR